jgi:hypothetical protein
VAEMSDSDMEKYRQGLVDSIQKLNENFDKLLVTLSGGALALSITFLRDCVGSDQATHTYILFVSWILFVLSLTFILSEILFGLQAHKKAVDQVDEELIRKVKRVGGVYSLLSAGCRWLAAISLVVGLVLVCVFTYFNIEDNHGSQETDNSATTYHSSTDRAAASTFSGSATEYGKPTGTKRLGSCSSA